jgi:hypothetical protein
VGRPFAWHFTGPERGAKKTKNWAWPLQVAGSNTPLEPFNKNPGCARNMAIFAINLSWQYVSALTCTFAGQRVQQLEEGKASRADKHTSHTRGCYHCQKTRTVLPLRGGNTATRTTRSQCFLMKKQTWGGVKLNLFFIVNFHHFPPDTLIRN